MFYVIIWLAKLAGGLSRLFGRGGGSALPGLFAEQSDDKILAHLGKRLRSGSIVVTGTNGKTTTTKMIQEILEARGYKIITNRSGSNLRRGLISTLIEEISWLGKFEADLGLFEVDEASMPAVCVDLAPKAVMVLNLFRDQLDRYGELDTTAELIGKAIEPLKGTQVYLNSDDPLVASLSRYVVDGGQPNQGPTLNPDSLPTNTKVGTLSPRVHYFGVEGAESIKLEHDLAADSDHCPFDGRPLDYQKNFFGHMGHYACPRKDFKRPEPETFIVNYQPGKAFTIKHKAQTAKLFLPLPGLYNAYNAVAAIAMTVGMSLELTKATQPLERVTAAFGRVERLEVDGREVYLLLIKNPTGFNQVIQTFLNGTKSHSVVVAINDNFADGRDVSWLWDVAFEEMAGKGHKIIASGIRATDLALRFKYADQVAKIEPKLETAFRKAIAVARPGETVYILPTYTAMLELRERVRTMGLVKGFWE